MIWSQPSNQKRTFRGTLIATHSSIAEASRLRSGCLKRKRRCFAANAWQFLSKSSNTVW